MRFEVKMFMEENGRYVDFVASPPGGIEITVLRVDKRLLNGDFAALVIDFDDRDYRPNPEPELSGTRRF